MSKIKNQCKNALSRYYTAILTVAIQKILRIIGESDRGITWNIFEEERSTHPLLQLQKSKYGYCDIEHQDIFISTAAIETCFPSYLSSLATSTPTLPLLYRVILDELAHAISKKDHGDPAYDKLLTSYHKKLEIARCSGVRFK